MAKDNDFGLQSNAGAPVTQEAAVTTIDRVAGEPAPMSAGQTDLGVAQADGKKTDEAGLKKEFELNDPNKALDAERGEPEKETDVETDPDAKKELEKKVEPEAKVEPEKKVAPGADDPEPVSEWLADVTVADRQDILDEFVTANIDDLKLNVRQDGADVEMTLGQLKRAASGYAGEAKAGSQIKKMKAEVERREKDLKDREKFITDQFNKPADLMSFLDAHVEDPVAYFTAVKEHAESVLSESEENPGRFRRDAATRRENAALRSDIKELKDIVVGRNGNTGTPDADTDEGPDRGAQSEEAIVAEGKARRDFVVEEGFEVDAVAKAWTDAGEPPDFYRWFAKFGLKEARDTSAAKVQTTKKNREKGGASLRRRGSANPKPAAAVDDGKVLDAKGIQEYLDNHPTNKGR